MIRCCYDKQRVCCGYWLSVESDISHTHTCTRTHTHTHVIINSWFTSADELCITVLCMYNMHCVNVYTSIVVNHYSISSCVHAHYADPPNAIMMDALQLVPVDKDLILRWNRPSNVPIEVAVDYTIIVNSTNGSTTVYNQIFTTNETSVSLQFLQAQILNDNAGDDCITFQLSVSGGNDAGSAELTTIMDSIPLCKILVHILLWYKI